jgi:hypothetical protein
MKNSCADAAVQHRENDVDIYNKHNDLSSITFRIAGSEVVSLIGWDTKLARDALDKQPEIVTLERSQTGLVGSRPGLYNPQTQQATEYADHAPLAARA